MPRNEDEQMLTLAEVCEMQPGDQDNPAWINPGFTATVDRIKERATKRGGTMWVCTLADPDSGATAEMAVFTAPRFHEGDLIEVSGNGMKREEFNGHAKIGTGKGTVIHVLSAAQGARQPSRAQPQPQRAAAPAEEPHTSQAMTGGRTIFGGTVGGSMRLAMDTMRFIYGPDELRDMIKTPAFWGALYELTSDFIRVQLPLEAGHVRPAIKDRVPSDFDEVIPPSDTPASTPRTERPYAQGTGRSDPPKSATKPKPGPDGAAFQHEQNSDEDVPF
jgi:hypothetical protein